MNDNQPTEMTNVEYYKRLYGDLEFDGNAVIGIIMTSANGTKWRQTVSNAGATVWTAI